ncbi:hypothetical protein SAY87_005932 [Trapa incisa]|uniref:VQ domain-containing protein n=2 Tax=Trapa TaxID=22665 RepID=A0AAN7KT29_TRANT|nr:hypothetical protein SAY87_005932 [Trapa incisa]KAK4772545.1 hypothetical protein SAY86_014320 [Trapa natans]
MQSYSSDPTSPQTTFVQADPSNFRSIVQKLTGAPEGSSSPKLPVTTLPSRASQKSLYSSSSAPAATSSPSLVAEIGPRKPHFKLHERRHRKLEQIQLSSPNRTIISFLSSCSPPHAYYLPVASAAARRLPPPSPSSTSPATHLCGRMAAVMVSPVSPLDLFARMSPGSSHSVHPPPISPAEKEQRAIAEKGFYLHHPSPLSTPRGAEPELLPLFPLHSPRYDPDQRP